MNEWLLSSHRKRLFHGSYVSEVSHHRRWKRHLRRLDFVHDRIVLTTAASRLKIAPARRPVLTSERWIGSSQMLQDRGAGQKRPSPQSQLVESWGLRHPDARMSRPIPVWLTLHTRRGDATGDFELNATIPDFCGSVSPGQKTNILPCVIPA